MIPSIKQTFIFILLFLCTDLTTPCKCPTRKPTDPPKPIVPFPARPIADEIHNGINYGKAVIVNKMTFLQADVAATGSTTGSISHGCPFGFRIPTKAEMEEVIASLGDDHTEFVSASGLNLTPDKMYLIGEKVHPNVTDGTNNDAYVYHGFQLKNGKLTLITMNTYWSGSNIIGKCIANEKIGIIVKPERGVILNRASEFRLSSQNVKGVMWKLNHVLYDSETMIKRFREAGCYLIEVFYITLTDDLEYDCVEITVINQHMFNTEPRFHLDKMHIVKTPYTASVSRMLFFSSANGPIAPKVGGGYYIGYQNSKNKTIMILEFNAQHEEIAHTSLDVLGTLYDLVATEWGFVLYHSTSGDGSGRSHLAGYHSDYTLRFNLTIIGNHNAPKQGKTQLCFFDGGCSPYFGMAAQYKPNNGRLSYANGKIQLTYTPYNNFNAGADGVDGHTGDHYVILDVNGDKPQIASAWSSSHSCIQSTLFDGTHFVAAALGDAYPQNIKINVINVDSVGTYIDPILGYHTTVSYTAVDFFSEIVPGDGAGNSCGRMGGLSFNGKTYAMVYSIKPCTTKYGSTELNEFGVATFEIENHKVVNRQKHIVHGIEGRNIVNLRAAQYGKNLLAVFSINEGEVGSNGQPWQGLSMNYKNYMVLLDYEGNALTEVLQVDETVYSMNDEMRVLHDGTVIWTAADSQTSLKIIHVDI